MPYVYSTATADITYPLYDKSSAHAAHSVIKRKVTIRGGANLATQTGRLVTPKGMVTRVTDEELDFLMHSEAFLRHKERGFMHVDKSDIDPDKVARDKGMNPKDGSAPITPNSKEVLGTATPADNKKK